MKQLCYLTLTLTLTLAFLMIGCSGGDEQISAKQTENTVEEKPEKIFSHQIDSLDKAKQVENLMLDRAKQQEKEIDNMSQ